MVTRVVDRLFVVYYGRCDPTEAEWARHLELMRSHGIADCVELVVTDGGHPSESQRVELDALRPGRAGAIAVVSESVAIRAAVTLLSWFNRKIQAFRPGELRDALIYLDIPVTRESLIQRVIDTMRAEDPDTLF